MKNFKLLLATTAILSTTLAMETYAVRDDATAEISTSVSIYSPLVITPGKIEFKDVIAKNNGTIVINESGNYDASSTATAIESAPVITPATFRGSYINGGGHNYDEFEMSSSAFSATDTHLYSGTGAGKIDCGETPIASFGAVFAEDTDNDGDFFTMTPYATFVMASDIVSRTQNAGGTLNCEGAVTFTLIHN